MHAYIYINIYVYICDDDDDNMYVCMCVCARFQVVNWSVLSVILTPSLFCFSAGPLAQKDPCGRSLRVQGLDFPRALGTAGWWCTTGNLTFAVPWVQFFFRICFSYLCLSFGIGKPSAWWFVDAFLTEYIEYMFQHVSEETPRMIVSFCACLWRDHGNPLFLVPAWSFWRR